MINGISSHLIILKLHTFADFQINSPFTSISRIFTVEGEDLRQWTSSEFDRSSSTIFLSVVGNEDHMLQVTDKELRLIPMISGTPEKLTVWSPPSLIGISRAATNGKQIVVGSGCDLFYLLVVDHSLNFVR